MYYGSIDSIEYSNQMKALSRMLKMYQTTLNSDVYKKGVRLSKLLDIFKSKHCFIKKVRTILSKKIGIKKIENDLYPFYRKQIMYEPNYFMNQKVAVYTCLFGKYDMIQTPYCYPDNIDYLIITDQPVPHDSIWKKMDISSYENLIFGLTDLEKNRWFKMHPHVFLKDYRYSVYVDANVVPVTDFSELVNRIGDCGVAMYWHKFDNCVYQEALININVLKKTTKDSIEEHITKLKKMSMPKDYGMTTCNVISRDHNNKTCIKLMDDWWEEFINGCKRDQLSFPYVAWKNGIAMDRIARLGNDVWSSHALYVVEHLE